MSRHVMALRIVCGVFLVVAVAFTNELNAANKTGQTFKKPIRNPKYDPQAEQVDLFEAVDAGLVTIRLIPKNALGGNVLIENKTEKSLTVKIPDAVAGVSIHSQAGNPGLGNLGLGNGGAGNQGGAQQQLGGAIGQLPGNGPAGVNGQNGPGVGQGLPGVGQGFFSIPADKVISLPFNSVCLEHGKPEPSGKSRYTLVPVSRISRDPVLYQLLTIVGTGKFDTKSTQAAAWHLANKMSFQTLAEKVTTPLGSLTQTPDFTREQIVEAEKLVAQARHNAADAELTKTE
jgi:hypothetical protein